MPPVWIGLTVAFASALVTNTAYSLEHDAAAALPPLSPRRPLRSAKLLLGDRPRLAVLATLCRCHAAGHRARRRSRRPTSGRLSATP